MEEVKDYKEPSKILPQWTTKGFVVPISWMKQFRYFTKMYEQIKDVEGDVVECGLGEGSTFSMLAYLVGSENIHRISWDRLSRTLWGFDSFEGWPEPTTYDASPRNPQKGEWKVPEEVIFERLEKSNIIKEFPWLEIEIIKGFFSETLPYFPDRKIAFLHIDADLYPGYFAALLSLFPKVSNGGIVLFDEYKEFPNSPEYGNGSIEKWPGCTKAVDEYFKNLPHRIQYWPETKKYYVVKK